MGMGDSDKLLLGKNVPSVDRYAPELLFPISRAEARKHLGLTRAMHGYDQWHAYELSWLDPGGKPQARVGRFMFPSESPCMIESKSFKLYLNSLNNHVFESELQLIEQLIEDLGRVSQSRVDIQLFELEATELGGAVDLGHCLDKHEPSSRAAQPDASMLEVESAVPVEEVLYSNLLRSLCPVTAQPDWATLRVSYRGPAISHPSLLGYIIAYRNHQEFHEQCVERIFSDILASCAPEHLEIQGFYTRRGGLDINPFRSTEPSGRPLPRLNRQ